MAAPNVIVFRFVLQYSGVATEGHPYSFDFVTIPTGFGSTRIVDMLVDDQLTESV